MSNHGNLGEIGKASDKVYIPGVKRPDNEKSATYDETNVYTNKYDNGADKPTSGAEVYHGTSTDGTARALNQGFTNYICYDTTSNNNSSGTVTQANFGQIIGYPYTLKKEIKVSTTHTQYYQLNLEDDDIVVWYTMKSDKLAYNDVRNNYYIYNKGNITFSGVGHDSTLLMMKPSYLLTPWLLPTMPRSRHLYL
jgi:hypothetical protein